MATISTLAGTQSGTDCLDSLYDDLVSLNAEVEAITTGSIAWTYADKTASYTVVASSDTYGTKVFTNDGATATITFSLPAGVAGMRVGFNVVDAYTLKVSANGTETIRYQGTQTAAGGYVQSATVGTFWIMEFNGDEWVITTLSGTLTHASGDFFEGLNEYDWMYIDAGAMVGRSTTGASAGTKEYSGSKATVDYFAFDGGAGEEAVSFKAKMDPKWNRGTIKAKFDWSSDTGSSTGDTAEWGIRAVSFGDGDSTLGSAFGTAQVISDILLSTGGRAMQTTSATPAITIGGTPALGDQVFFEVYRNTDGTDTMTEDAWLFGATIEYKKTKTVAAW